MHITEANEKIRLRKVFSRVAGNYDIYSSLQKRIAQRLLDCVCKSSEEPKTILDIGMGTGWLTERLSLHYPASKVFGVDFAEGMVVFASQGKASPLFAVADARSLPFKERSFGLAVSNLTYQWVNNLPSAFTEISRTLRKNSRVYLTFFGNDSLQELKSCFCEATRGRASGFNIQNYKLPDKELVYNSLLSADFKSVKVTSYIERELYDDLFGLVRWLKRIGANQITRPFFLGQEIWGQANRVYLSRYRDNGKVLASFEVIWAEALKE